MSRPFHPVALVGVLIGLAPIAASAQTLDEIIAKNLAAKGGVETLRATNTARLRAVVNLPAQGPVGEALVLRMTVSTKRPNLVRRDTTRGNETQSLGFDGQTAWQSTPGGAMALKGPQAEQIKSEGEFDSVLLTYREQGHQVELTGEENLEGRRVHVVRVKRKAGPVQTYYLDAETGLEHRVVTEGEARGERFTTAMHLSDYRTVDGRTMPFRARQFVNGQLAAAIVFEQIEFNIPLDDELFRMPASRR